MPKPPSSKYWSEREEYLQNQLLKIGEDYYVDLAKSYDKAALNIQKEIENFYYRFAKENKIDYADAKRILTSAERKQFGMSLDEYIEKGRTLNYSAQHSKALENASTVHRVSRLQSLQLQMQQQVEELSAKYDMGLNKAVTNIYKDGYYRNMYELQKGIGIGTDFTRLDTKTVQGIVAKPWAADGKNFSERIWEDRDKLVDYLDKNVKQAFIRGDAPQMLIKDIQSKFNTTKSNAERLVLTESAFFSSKSTQDSYKKFGVEKFEYLSTLDSRTSSICRDMDGKVFDTTDYEIGVNAPPLHARCRSTTVPYFPPDEFDNMHERAARDKDGKYYTVPADMTYSKWYEKYVKGNAAYELLVKKQRYTSSDKKQHEKYREIIPDKVPRSLDEFQNMKYNNSGQWEQIKALKQNRINAMNFKDMSNLVGKLGNQEVRLWYKSNDLNIPNIIDKNKTLKNQAMQAHELRNMYRTQARDLMLDQKLRRELDIKKPNFTFNQLMEHKLKKYGLEGDKAYADVIRSSQTTNRKYDKKSGVKEE